jgi:quinol monooxygenase YgiN
MIFIVVKWKIRAEHVDGWLDTVAEFTEATRAEPGNLFFDWSRSVDDPATYVLVEAFADGAAGAAHVQSAHFTKAVDVLATYVAAKPEIINVEIPDATGWSEMGEITPR